MQSLKALKKKKKVKIVKLSSPLDVHTMLLELYGVDKHVCRHTTAFLAYL